MTTSSDGLREQARQAITGQSNPTVTVLSSLLAVQDLLRYLPAEAIDEVAIQTGASVNDVWGVASFYPNFRFAAPGRHMVEVCWGPTCHLLGAQALLQGVMAHLGVTGEGMTDDQEFSLKLNTCLGCCTQGPAIHLYHELAGQMTLKDALQRIDAIREKKAHS